MKALKVKKTKTKGIFWHVHHDLLLEYCRSYKERAKYIKFKKPPGEVEERLRLFKPVRGKLPKEILEASAAYDKAYVACDKADAALDKAHVACDKADVAYEKASAAYDKAYVAFDKASTAFDKARAAYKEARAAREKARAAYRKASTALDKADAAREKALKIHKEEIGALHNKECPNCSWDGEKIRFLKND